MRASSRPRATGRARFPRATRDLLRSRRDSRRVARSDLSRSGHLVPPTTGTTLRMKTPDRTISGVDVPGEEQTVTVLRERAFAAMERAYAPYSNFRVGAALLC